MLAEQMLSTARARLATVAHDSPLMEAARLLRPGFDLIVVCGAEGGMVGVISKGDVVGQIGHCAGASCRMGAARVMSREVVSCRPDELISDIWVRMKEHCVRNAPIVDAARHPLGVINSWDTLQELLKETEDEQELLIEYVNNIGYR